ncbi:hypothetical protein Mapa_005387 [Marchantia paleacea]|nr:hypothetical protein Mapa_005387 [Marchantia paleacea]
MAMVYFFLLFLKWNGKTAIVYFRLQEWQQEMEASKRLWTRRQYPAQRAHHKVRTEPRTVVGKERNRRSDGKDFLHRQILIPNIPKLGHAGSAV